MTDRGGRSIRGASLRHTNAMVNSLFPMDSPRRGRGRPRKFPLTTPLQMPEEEEIVLERQGTVEESATFAEDDRCDYYDEERNGEHVRDLEAESAEQECEEDSKMKNVHRQKLITSMVGLKGVGKVQVPYPKSIQLENSDVRYEMGDNGQGTSQEGGEVVSEGENSEDNIEPLLPKEAHIEDANVVDEEETKEKPPPPPPRSIFNKMNLRGRQAVVPPHRRPIPKDLVPPGLPKDTGIIKRNILIKEVIKKNDDNEKHVDNSEKSNEMEGGKKDEPSRGKKREAGKDLPFEHMPKQKARHVTRAGIVPNVSYEAMKTYDVPLVEEEEQVIMHEGMMDAESSSEQQEMIALQEGEYIETREDDDQKEMINTNTRYIEVEEDGINVVYEVQEGEVIGEANDEIVDEVIENPGTTQYVIEEQHGSKNQDEMVAEDDDLPPQLVPEEVQDVEAIRGAHRRQENDVHEEVELKKESDVMHFDMSMMESGQTFRLSSPGGRTHDVQLARDEDGNTVFIDENGVIVELITDNGQLVEPSGVMETSVQEEQEEDREHEEQEEERQEEEQHNAADNRNVEFNFLDSRNICCGLCGEIVLYETLVSEHLPSAHPEFLQPGVELEEVPYENWLRSRLRQEAKNMQDSFRPIGDHPESQQQAQARANAVLGGAVRLFSRGLRQLRKVSQIRVNPNEMTLDQLEVALQRKMLEKLGRKVPVSLVDRLHARCDICQAVVSLNKKFEVIHLVRHFNAWHPSEHRCSNSWKDIGTDVREGEIKTLSPHDFAIVDSDGEQNNLQCIWCGMFMDRTAIGMHFSEVHRGQIEVPKCSLCLQEMVMSSRLRDKYGEDFGISLPDEFHVECSRLQAKYSSEKALENAIDRYLKRLRNGQSTAPDVEDEEDDKETICTTNSQQTFGRRNRLKRKFVKPCFRQICPTNSQYFEAYSACEWKCKLCGRNVYGAVISAGAIKHYKEFHPAEMENMQYELVKARLERIGDGSMEFVHPQLVECLICNMTYSLHKPFNICRAIRHLRLKHPEVMPETTGKPISGAEIQETTATIAKSVKKKNKIEIGELITDPVILERFRRYHDVEFDKVQVIYGARPNNEPSHVLLMEGESLDLKTAEAIADSIMSSDGETTNPLKRSPSEQSILFADAIRNAPSISGAFDPNEPTSSSARQPNNGERFEHELVEDNEELQERKPDLMQLFDTYSDAGDASEIISMDGNVIIPQENYEMIQEDGQFSGQEDRVQYMTEEELREAEARGDIQIEYVDTNDINFEEFNDGQQHAV